MDEIKTTNAILQIILSKSKNCELGVQKKMTR